MPSLCHIYRKYRSHDRLGRNRLPVRYIRHRFYEHVRCCHRRGRKHLSPVLPLSGCPATHVSLRGSALPVFGEELLPDTVGQNVFVVIADIYVDCIIAVGTTDLFDPGQVHYFRMLAEIPDVGFVSGQTGTMDTTLLTGTDTDSLSVFV